MNGKVDSTVKLDQVRFALDRWRRQRGGKGRIPERPWDLCTALLKKSVRGGLIIVGEINLGGSIEPIHNPVTLAELAVEKGASALLMPVSCRRQLIDLSDDMATKIDVQFYSEVPAIRIYKLRIPKAISK